MNLDELERLAKAATPGRWRREFIGGNYAETVLSETAKGRLVTVARIASGAEKREQDASYIAACSPDVILRLLAVVRAADAMRLVMPTWVAGRANFDAVRAQLEQQP